MTQSDFEKMAALLQRLAPRARINELLKYPPANMQARELEEWLDALDGKANPALIAAITTLEHAATRNALAPVVNTGRRVRKPFKEANKDRANESVQNRERWQKAANELWARRPELSCRRVAQLIALETRENPGTIRKRIKKK